MKLKKKNYVTIKLGKIKKTNIKIISEFQWKIQTKKKKKPKTENQWNNYVQKNNYPWK